MGIMINVVNSFSGETSFFPQMIRKSTFRQRKSNFLQGHAGTQMQIRSLNLSHLNSKG